MWLILAYFGGILLFFIHISERRDSEGLHAKETSQIRRDSGVMRTLLERWIIFYKFKTALRDIYGLTHAATSSINIKRPQQGFLGHKKNIFSNLNG